MISICVTSRDQANLSTDQLKQLLDSLCNQTYRRFEVVISDNSQDKAIQKFLEEANYKLDINYLKYDSDKKSVSARINHTIRHAKYPIIKPIFLDDRIISDKMIARIMSAKGKWGAMGWKQSNKPKEYIPRWTKHILSGTNRMGCSSGIFFEKKDDLLFDENLVSLMDAEFFYRLYQAYGVPYYINETCFISNTWNKSVDSRHENASMHYKELRYLEEKLNRNDLVKKFDQQMKLRKLTKSLESIKHFIFRC